MLKRSLRRTEGIYLIENTVNGRCYIGASTRVGPRWQAHRYSLREGNHHNAALLADWVLHGESAFRFTVVEEFDTGCLDWSKEQAWMDRYSAIGRELYNYGHLLINSNLRPGFPEVKRKRHKW